MESLAGSVGAVLIVALGYATRQGKAIAFYSMVLVVIALGYVLFAAITMHAETLLAESAVTGGFNVVAVVGARSRQHRAAGFVVGGAMIAHGLCDLIHNALIISPAVPSWWPGFCAVVDILVGGWLIGLVLTSRIPVTTSHPSNT